MGSQWAWRLGTGVGRLIALLVVLLLAFATGGQCVEMAGRIKKSVAEHEQASADTAASGESATSAATEKDSSEKGTADSAATNSTESPAETPAAATANEDVKEATVESAAPEQKAQENATADADEKQPQNAESETAEKTQDESASGADAEAETEAESDDPDAVEMTEGAETEEESAEPMPVVAFDSIEALQGVLPRQTEAYEILPEVKINGPYYRFHITTEHGDYEIDSIIKLLKVCHEIHVIEAYRREFHASPVLKGSVDAVVGMGKGAANIVIRPGQSLKGIGRMIGRIGRGAADVGLTPLVGQQVSDTGENRAAIPAGLLFPKQARQFAFEQDLDVYSDNPNVRKLIAAVAARLGTGRWAVKIAAKYFAPIPYVGTVTRGALTPGERNNEIEILLLENGSRELYRLLYVMYRDLFDLSDDDDAPEADKAELQAWLTFLHNPNYSPREKAYSYCYFRDMKGIEGRAAAVTMLAGIKKIRNAMLAARQLELMAALHLNGPVGLARLVPGKTMLAGRTEYDGIVLIVPYDMVDETDRMRDLRLWLVDEAKASGAVNVDFWAVGTISQTFRDAAKADGVDVLDGILREPEFRTSRMKKLYEPLLDAERDEKGKREHSSRRRRVPLEEKVSPNPPKLQPEQWIVS